MKKLLTLVVLAILAGAYWLTSSAENIAPPQASAQARPVAPAPPAGMFGTSEASSVRASPATVYRAAYLAEDLYAEFAKLEASSAPDAPYQAMNILAACGATNINVLDAGKPDEPGLARMRRRCAGFKSLLQSATDFTNKRRALEQLGQTRGGSIAFARNLSNARGNTPTYREGLSRLITEGHVEALWALKSSATHMSDALLDGDSKGMADIRAASMMTIAFKLALCDSGIPCGQQSTVADTRCIYNNGNSTFTGTAIPCGQNADSIPFWTGGWQNQADLEPEEREFVTRWRGKFQQAIARHDPTLLGLR